ncbi:MAG TPA: prepilin-type N-terminal cleavage/methylation domain-containing protein [Planctomycetota bacterium]|nr:prepilin-type N-terminal cleavage/methylation domain-containing protein [Planctomycetota bacterium]
MMGLRAPARFPRPLPTIGSGLRRAFTLIEMLVVIVIIMILAGLLIPTVMRAICNAKAGSMEAMLTSLEQAAKSYETDTGAYPQSNGNFDSAPLAAALRRPSARHGVYYDFKESQIDTAGNIVNMVQPSDDTVKYRNNSMTKDKTTKGIHNKNGIDLWTRGCDKEPESINNWD